MGKYPRAFDWEKNGKTRDQSGWHRDPEQKKAQEEQTAAAQENAKQLRITRRAQERRERAEAYALAEPARRAARQAEHAKLMEQHAKFKKERDELVAHIKAQLLAKKLGDKGQLAKIDEALATEDKTGEEAHHE